MTPTTPGSDRTVGGLLRLVATQGAAPAELVTDVARMSAGRRGEAPERALARAIPALRRGLPRAA